MYFTPNCVCFVLPQLKTKEQKKKNDCSCESKSKFQHFLNTKQMLQLYQMHNNREKETNYNDKKKQLY